jgi:hypothetical protein
LVESNESEAVRWRQDGGKSAAPFTKSCGL